MSGIEILNTYVEKGNLVMPWLGIAVLFVVLGMLGVLSSCYFNDCWIKTHKKLYVAYMAVFGAILVTGFAIGCVAPKEPIYVHEVIVSDEVGFNEFNARYEVISRNGEIYLVQERESE